MATPAMRHLDDWLKLDGSESTAERGKRFERAVRVFMESAAGCRDRFSQVTLWEEWAERDGHDRGIDLVAWDHHVDGWCAVQAKYYDPSTTLRKEHVDSFLATSSQTKFASRIIATSAVRFADPLTRTLNDQAIPVTRISAEQMMTCDIDWNTVNLSAEYAPTIALGPKKTLRPHQQEAVEAVFTGFSEDLSDGAACARGKLIMACGTGKTFTSLKIVERMASEHLGHGTPPEHPVRVLFMAPSIALVDQTLREWQRESETPFAALAVCSDTNVGRTTEDLSSIDLVIPATTDSQRLREQLQTRSERPLQVIFSTYQSIGVVIEAMMGLPALDLILCDEAHRTTGVTLAGSDESQFVRVHDNFTLPATRRLYMTATPRLYGDESKKKADAADAVVASMDDPAYYGREYHRLGFGDAVERDLLTDYKVLVLAVSERYIAMHFQQSMAESGALEISDAAKIIGCWNGLAKRFDDDAAEGGSVARASHGAPMRRAVAFTKTIAASQLLSASFPTIVDQHAVSGDIQTDDRLRVEVDHVDGTMNALERTRKLEWLKAGPDADDNACRILSNARCLSEGVDVPALDAVIFMTPRGSQVDIVQSVGRVMRKAPGKDLGYIILPIAIPEGMDAAQALNENKKYEVVWQVLQALRAHDERFQAMINQIELSGRKPDRLSIVDVTPPDRKDRDGGGFEAADEAGRGASGTGRGRDGSTADVTEQLALDLHIDEWRDALYAKIVAKVGERKYWETWTNDIAEIARLHVARITVLVDGEDSPAAADFDTFLDGLRANLNEGISQGDAIEMLAQHLITRPVFEALFAGTAFTENNPVAQTMERILGVLDAYGVDDEAKRLQEFYRSVQRRVEGITDAKGRQRLIVELYDKFFAGAFPKTVSKLGIVYTPVEIVDFILRSADDVLRHEFGQGLTNEGVHIVDPFTGTGTFMVRLLQSGLVSPHDLARKFANELHANEILLLAYYIAAVNIESTYSDIADEYEPFPGLVLTDTFQSFEEADRADTHLFIENNARLDKLKDLDIRVIVGNPPYSVGQSSANDDNANERYEHLDAAIRDTYAARTDAQNKNSLYDSYIRAIKWASMRIKDRGVVAYVTNGGFLDGNTAAGMRKCLLEEFSSVYVYNLRGNTRTSGEEARREGGQTFGGGSRATVAIILLVKNPDMPAAKVVHYRDVGDYLTREQKLATLAEAPHMRAVATDKIVPNKHGDWLNQRREDFDEFIPLGSDGVAVFSLHSGGVKTNRDAWCYNSSREKLETNMRTLVNTYNNDIAHGTRTADDRLIKWNRSLITDFERGRVHEFEDSAVRVGMYRPFDTRHMYFSRPLNDMVYRQFEFFPTESHVNWGIIVTAPRVEIEPAILAIDSIPDASFFTYVAQFFTRYRYENIEANSNKLNFDGSRGEDSDIYDGYRRLDNISTEGLAHFQAAYGHSFTADDVFDYCYGLLHSPEYRETYRANLKKSLPRIPLVADASSFVEAGKQLRRLHIGYESVTPHPLDGLDATPPAGVDPYDFYRVEKMKPGKGKNRSIIEYNSRITLSGIPDAAYRHELGSRSALAWIIDRYQVKLDKKSGITNDPNDWSREAGDPRYILDLVARIVTVSLETVSIVDALPGLNLLPNQNPTGLPV